MNYYNSIYNHYLDYKLDILTARWHAAVALEHLPELKKFTMIVVYDEDGQDVLTPTSTIRQILDRLKDNRLDSAWLRGGISAVETSLAYMVTSHVIGVPERQLALSWYPSIIVEDTLWLGRIEQGMSPATLLTLSLTHLVHIGQTRPALAFPGMTCLTVDWNNNLKG